MDQFESLLASANQRLQRLSQTEDYQKNCPHFLSECDRLTQLAASLLARQEELRQACEALTSRTEYASGCKYLHRGFYAPSPVLPMIVTGLKRGKLLKRLTMLSKPSFEYGFDADGKLLWAKGLDNNTPISTEFLVRENNAVYGITLTAHDDLQSITEEIYEDGRIIRYTKGMNFPFSREPSLYELACETYTYESSQLQCCHWHRLTIPPQGTSAFADKLGFDSPTLPVYQHDVFFFAQKDGRLVLVGNK